VSRITPTDQKCFVEAIKSHVGDSSRAPRFVPFEDMCKPLRLLSLGACQALDAASDASSGREPLSDAKRTVEDALKSPDTSVLLQSLYGLPNSVPLLGAELIATGTTSWIVKTLDAQSERSRALKLVLPRYFNDRVVTENSRSYKDRFKSLNDNSHVPTVYRSEELWIEMDYVDGRTLDDYLASKSQGAGAADGVRETRRVLDALLLTLSEICASSPGIKAHGDLSPTNIIVVDSNNDRLELNLIDFGRNTLLEDGIGSTLALEKAALFCSPEIKAGEDPTWRSDAFSLGMISLDIMYRFGQRNSADSDSKRVEKTDGIKSGEDGIRLTVSLVDAQFNRVWETSPRLARTLEDLLDRKPENRGLIFPGGKTPTDESSLAYKELMDASRSESEIEEVFHGAGGERKQVASLVELVLGRTDRLRGLWGVAKQSRRSGSTTNASGLFWVALTTVGLWVTATAVLLAKAGGLSLIGWMVGGFKVSALQHLWHQLTLAPGVLVVWTFGLALVAYYINIFALIGHLGSGDSLLRWSYWSMRIQPIVSLTAIITVMLFFPEYWPFASGMIMLFTVVNNWIALRLVKRSADEGAKDLDPISRVDPNFISRFSNYPLTMGLYAGGLVVLGVLIFSGTTTDEWEFAILVMIVNIVQMGQIICVKEAPWVRGNVDRAIFTIRRIDTKRNRDGQKIPMASAMKPEER